MEISSEDRGLALEIALGVCRNDILLGYLAKNACANKKVKKSVLTILQIAIYQLLYLKKIPDFAVLNTSVALAKKIKGKQVGGFVNAVLRKIIEQGLPDVEDISQEIEGSHTEVLSVWYSMPEWLIKKWLEEFGLEVTIKRLEQSLAEAPSWLRVNLLKITAEDFQAKLETEFEIKSKILWGRYFKINHGIAKLLATTAFSDGLFSIQDPASFLVCQMLKLDENKDDNIQILDACAAPGGKTALILELTEDKVEVLACDNSESRLERMNDIKTRLNLQSFKTRVMDALEPDLEKSQLFDRILIDAPCSNLGVVARRPELKSNISVEALKEIATKQLNILESLSSYVKDDGIIVYSTCSPEFEETTNVIKQFLDNHDDYVLEKVENEILEPYLKDDCLKLIPGSTKDVALDGFFAACLRKKVN